MTLWQRIRRLLRPPRQLKITKLGRTYLVLTVGIGLGALNTGNNLLYLVLGFMLSIIVLSGVLSERAIWDVKLKRLLPDGAFAKEPFALRYEVTRQKGRAFALKLREADGSIEGWAWVPLLSEGEPLTVRAEAVANRRGPHRLSLVEISTAFPLGIFEKSRLIKLDDLLVVFPRRGFSCPPLEADAGRQAGDGGNPRLRDGNGDILGLRDLGDREDARRIHWKKSASIGKLVKVEREREDRRQFTLRVDAGLPSDALERACEETAAATQQLLSEGHEVGLHTGVRRIRPGAGPGHERRLLTALAWVGFTEPPP